MTEKDKDDVLVLQTLVKYLFSELYLILRAEGADPEENCYTITGVETDLLNILAGKLASKQANGKPFLYRIPDDIFLEPFPPITFQFKDHTLTPRPMGTGIYWFIDGIYVGPVGTLCPKLLNNAIAQQETYDDYKLPF